MYLLYSLLLALGFALAAPWFIWKGRGDGRYLRSFRERMGRLPSSLRADGRQCIWIHAVSVGEVLAARALIGPLKRRFPAHCIVISTTTVTGQAVARNSLREAEGLFYVPFDWPRPVRKALEVLSPWLLLLVETELWPNLIHQAHRRGTRIALVNGRISPRSFARYRRIRCCFKQVLSEVDLLLMQEPSHVRRIVEMGAPPARVRALGNLKFDALEPPRAPEGLARLLSSGECDSRPIWVAGSTVGGEEECVLRAFRQVRDAVPGARLILAPRHPERFDSVPPLVEAAGLLCERRSRLGIRPWEDGEVLLLDSMGELAQVYPLASVVFVGGSLVPAGGHNVLEPAVAGKAVVVGPHMENFQEIADRFREAGALVQIASAAELAPAVLALLGDDSRRHAMGERARAVIEQNRGALQRTLEALEELAR